ncbi:putative peptidase (DUF1758) domain-containing protein [Phthorimaea operculella]|nr:putative peptidase (DUF1758) domain-containing protein [Phthorimaea operculella]
MPKTAEEEAITALRQKRGYKKQCLTKLFTSLGSLDLKKLSLEALVVYKEKLQTDYAAYDNINEQLFVAGDKECETDAYEDPYMQHLVLLSEIIASKKPPPQSSQGSHDDSIANVKLPTIAIPVFTGKFIEYKAFIGLFDSLVHQDTKLSDIQKLYYLRNFLKNEPYDLICNLPLVDSSYKESLTILKERYDNKYVIISEHVNKLLDLQPITKSTASSIRSFVCAIKQQLGALRNLTPDTDKWDQILICILTRKLDVFSNRDYQFSRDVKKEPSVKELIEFLEKKALGLENAASASCVPSTSTPVERAQPVQYKKGSSTSACNVVVKTAPTCSFCKSPSHKLFSCDKFKALPSNERVRFAEENKLCRTCLTAHTNKCKFFFKCGTCRGQHNTLMHEEQTEQPSVAMVTESVGQEMLLPTVQVKLRAADGSEVIARGVLDSCSQNSFVTADLVKQLGLQPKAISASVVGIGNVAQNIHQGVDLEVQSVVTSYKRSIHCYVTKNITSQLPHNKIDLRSIKVPSHLADTTFDTPGNVQILMAADVFFQALVLQPGESDYVSPNTPVKPEDQSAHPDLYFINTRFGVIVAGTPPNLCHYRQAQKQLALFCQTCSNDINDTIQDFWKAETVPEIFPEKSTEHEQAEQIFKETVKLENNKFQVSLPLKLIGYADASSVTYGCCLYQRELEQNTLWWQGLSYLCDSEYSPSDANIDLSQDLPELKTVAADLPLSCAVVCTEESDDCFDLDFLNKFSSITKMQRVLAYVRRFCKNLIPLASVITLLLPS